MLYITSWLHSIEKSRLKVTHKPWLRDMGLFFHIWIRKVITSDRKCNIDNVLSHWLGLYSLTVTVNVHRNPGIHVQIYTVRLNVRGVTFGSVILVGCCWWEQHTEIWKTAHAIHKVNISSGNGFPCSAPNHYPNQYWFVGRWTPWNVI